MIYLSPSFFNFPLRVWRSAFLRRSLIQSFFQSAIDRGFHGVLSGAFFGALPGAVLLLLIVFSLSPSKVYAHPNDPLNKTEISKALTLTQSPAQQISAQHDLAARGTAPNPDHIELLLIERHYTKNAPAGQRRADVYVYDYDADELIESLVDLNTSEVISTQRKQNIQLPLTENEIRRAKQIVFEDEEERRILEDEYQRITSRPFSTVDELNIKAFTFTRDSLPNRVNEASKLCGLHRCAQMMLYTGENIVFEVSPIVNLSKGVVTQRIGF